MSIAISPGPFLHPHPVLLIGSYGADGKPNLMTCSWGGICGSQPPCVAIALRAATLTYHNILHSQAFSVGLPAQRHVGLADYVGVVSGREHDKFAQTGLTPVASDTVRAPLAVELPVTLECKLVHHHALGLHTLFVGEIVGVRADEAVLNPKGLPDIEKVQAILWGGRGSNHYYAVGPRLAKAFSTTTPPATPAAGR